MTTYEFAFSVLVALLVFLGFALTIAAILLGSKRTAEEAAKTFKMLAKRLFDMFS
jgi:hypothetical protein